MIDPNRVNPGDHVTHADRLRFDAEYGSRALDAPEPSHPRDEPAPEAGADGELKPCPFCSGRAKYTANSLYGDDSMAQCRKCGASAYWRKWNVRALDSPAPAPAEPMGDVGLVDRERNAWRENCQNAAVARCMIRDAIGELFGPIASLESEEAVLLRGPEAAHEAEAIIEALQRVSAALDEAQKVIAPFAEVAHGEVWERFISDSKMVLRISNGDGSRHYCFVNAECFEGAHDWHSKHGGGGHG